MEESGTIKRPKKTFEQNGFCDWIKLSGNIWRASRDGKFWLFKTSKDSSAASVEMLRREYEISCKIINPFILSALEFQWETPVGPAIVMEYIDGRTLGDFIKESPSEATRKKILGQILYAVEYLHRCDILHNDIKPANILVTTAGDDVKIIDFGLSDTGADFLNRHLGGTTGFTAPEVLSGDTSSTSSGTADIFSLGAIIRLLFPKRYRSIAKKCLRNDPLKRYNDIDSLRRAIIRRDRRPMVLGAACVLLIMLTVSIVPEILSHQKTVAQEMQEAAAETKEKLAHQDTLRRIQSAMEIFYREAADTMNNKELVRYQEFADIPRGTFSDRFWAYRIDSLTTETYPIIDSIYAVMLDDLNKIQLTIPSISDAESAGLITTEESNRCIDLYVHGRYYTPAE